MARSAGHAAPGKRALTDGLTAQVEPSTDERAPVQRQGGADNVDGEAHAAAAVGVSGPGTPLPHLKGGLGDTGDIYERQADAVADLVVEGKSAEALLAAPAGPALAPPVVQRKVTEGWAKEDSWNAGRVQVDKEGHAARPDGSAVPNAQAKGDPIVGNAVTRIPLEGLTNVKGGQAIVVVPPAAVLNANANANASAITELDVLLHYHGGYNDKSEESADSHEKPAAKKGGKPRTRDGELTHDLHLAKVPQQMAAFGGKVLAITVERNKAVSDKDERSRSLISDGLVDEVFDHLRQQTPPILTANHKRGRTIVSGYSYGAHGAIDEATEHQPGQGKAQETVQGLFLFDPVTTVPAMALIKRRLDDDLAQLTKVPRQADQLDYLKTKGYMVRIFAQDPLFNASATRVQADIDKLFAPLEKKVPADPALNVTDQEVQWHVVMKQWRWNYQAIAVPRQRNSSGQPANAYDTHGNMEGDASAAPIWDRNYAPSTGNLEQALRAWADRKP